MEKESRSRDDEPQQQQQQLKHLGFVESAAVNTLLCLSTLYNYAKRNAGPLKPALDTLEGAVSAAVAPLHHKCTSFPSRLLSFLDHKVDEAAVKFDEHAPPVAKQVAGRVHCMIKKAAEAARDLVHEAQANGPSAAAYHAASESKELALRQAVKAWAVVGQIPPFHALVEIAVPTAAHWSERYNRVVMDLSSKGYAVFGYLPLIPVGRIAKAFKQAESHRVKGVAED